MNCVGCIDVNHAPSDHAQNLVDSKSHLKRESQEAHWCAHRCSRRFSRCGRLEAGREAIADRMVAGSASPGWMLMEAIPESSVAVSASEGGLCWESSMSWVFNVDWWRWAVSGQREEAGLMNTRAWPRKSVRNSVTTESSTKQRRPAVTYLPERP